MRYVSTRGDMAPQTFAEILLGGLCSDGGLAMPESYPRVSPAELAAWRNLCYADLAYEILHKFCDDIPAAELKALCAKTYTKAIFRTDAIIPVKTLEPGLHLLELSNGPTLAFKDIAMQLVARMMDHVLAQGGERATVIAATSGDTGGAAVEAFRGRKRVDVVVLFPKGRVSDVQRRMMTTASDANVHALAIEGTFDDCQAIVKTLFNDQAFRKRVKLSSVNSINWARIVAQAVYYFTAAAALGGPGKAVTFVVPTGNFGDIFAGYAAKRMGLVAERLVIATNVNDILARTLASGRYEPRAVVATLSPAMDIQVSSNFERLLFEAYGREAVPVRALMQALADEKGFSIGKAALDAIRADFEAGRADEDETRATIRDVHRLTGYLLDPHGAVGLAVARKRPHRGRSPVVVLGTAHPAKFPDAVEAATGFRPQLPASLANLMTLPERVTALPADKEKIVKFVA